VCDNARTLEYKPDKGMGIAPWTMGNAGRGNNDGCSDPEGRQQAGRGNNFEGHNQLWSLYQPIRTYGEYSKPLNRKNRQQ
jgi:hypothetical protein